MFSVPLLLLALSSCKQECSPTSCPAGMYCNLGTCVAECVTSADCSPAACDPEDDCCDPERTCNTSGRCISSDTSDEACDVEAPFPPDGWDDPPGTGVTFIVNQIAVAGRDYGANLDGRCSDGRCIDNLLWRLGELGNDQIRQGLLGGESLMLLEITGLTENYAGFDRSVTVKLYAARDADEPFFPANNFKIPPGHTTCCEFLVDRNSLEADGRTARARLPARIRNGRIESVRAGRMVMPFCPSTGAEIVFENAVFSAQLEPSMAELGRVLLAGVLPSSSLIDIENPYCKTVSPRCPVALEDTSIDDLARALIGQNDIDLDGDGLECAYDSDGDSITDRCCDGAGNLTCPTDPTCLGEELFSTDPARPGRCRERIVDGFSGTLTMTGIRASVVGTN